MLNGFNSGLLRSLFCNPKINSPNSVDNSWIFTGKEYKRETYVTITVKRGNKELSRDFVVMQFKNDVFNFE